MQRKQKNLKHYRRRTTSFAQHKKHAGNIKYSPENGSEGTNSDQDESRKSSHVANPVFSTAIGYV
jgi:hypothetical protein